MSVEVISLLSSSDAGSPPPQRARLPSPPPPPIIPRARALLENLESDDVFSPALSRRREADAETANSDRRPNAQTAADDVWLVSDDELVPSKNVRQQRGTAVDGPAAKRRRLDSLGVNISSPDSAPVRAAQTTAPLRASGPVHPNPTAPPRLSAEQPKPRRDWLDDDPFASSSPQVAKQPPGRVNDRAATLPSSYLDDNPFSSSAQQKEPEPAKSNDRPVIADDIDPFASSSPGLVSRLAKPAQPAAAWDPISSSAPLPATADDEPRNPSRSFRRTQSAVITLDDDSDNDCIAEKVSDDEFPDITNLATSKHRFNSLPRLPAVSTAAQPPRKPKSVGTKTNPAEPRKTSLEKAKEKEEKTAAREAEKERKRLEKERAKEERVQEKAKAAALAEVNKIRTDKKVATPEMIVDLPTTLDESVKLQAATLLRDLDVHSAAWPSPVENVVKWRRKVSSRYNSELGHWEPVPERIERENYAMVVVPAAHFVNLVLGDETANLESHVLRMKRHFPNDTIIYLIEGLALWLRKNRNVRNRQFVSAVRSGLEPTDDNDDQRTSNTQQQQQQQQRKRKTAAGPQTYIDEDTVETSLLQLQILHGVLIHHTTIPLETARWIAVFTQHISTVPYRRQRDAANDAGFCMETGQVRTGDGPRDTYVRMLQEIGRVTAPIAYGIAAEFGSVPELVRGLEDGGPLTLEKVRKSVNKSGEVSDRAVGQSVSRRVYKIFLGRDEGSTDI
ncbi:ERCC4 domain-containing protein [Parachaetomium inaequale]|uniref:ERCC4 domain-containing protein n=1 Tax=Parachaetomium inaequale TaxID=2588326 RepID=A0AAN6PML5_9PEZI|nr:ERCC4 domain-containing protein [Parachaetomium inaequale]